MKESFQIGLIKQMRVFCVKIAQIYKNWARLHIDLLPQYLLIQPHECYSSSLSLLPCEILQSLHILLRKALDSFFITKVNKVQVAKRDSNFIGCLKPRRVKF